MLQKCLQSEENKGLLFLIIWGPEKSKTETWYISGAPKARECSEVLISWVKKIGLWLNDQSSANQSATLQMWKKWFKIVFFDDFLWKNQITFNMHGDTASTISLCCINNWIASLNKNVMKWMKEIKNHLYFTYFSMNKTNKSMKRKWRKINYKKKENEFFVFELNIK